MVHAPGTKLLTEALLTQRSPHTQVHAFELSRASWDTRTAVLFILGSLMLLTPLAQPQTL